MQLDEHPTVKKLKARPPGEVKPQSPVSAQMLKEIARKHGADDAGLVDIGRPSLKSEIGHIRSVFSETKTLLAICGRMNREPVRSVVRSVANQEFHAVYDEINDIARAIVRELSDMGIPACNAVAAFPMEAQLPGRTWTVAHKPIAVEAGLGHMGLHRSVIHPVFGSFILLDTVLIGVEADSYDQPVDYNPCLECKLCVAACPVGALKPNGSFDFMSCFTHNYREFLGNFNDFVEAAVVSKDMKGFRKRISDGETASMWQSLSFKPGYKAAYCLAVCPAGEDVINPYLEDKAEYLNKVVKPLQKKEETLFVLPGSDAEEFARKRFPHKEIKRVRRHVAVGSVKAFIAQMPLAFQTGRSKGLDAVFHWTFDGQETIEVTVRIADQKLQVSQGHVGEADVRVFADAKTWLDIVNREYKMINAIVLRKIRVKGSMTLFRAFGRCFPG
ncbi:SCP2 sterol-binding domain-containing protein [Rhizobium sp. L1K21]|uniref:SCP2 sterol-binding domain-containing protein n=1 Tax=Rhizobium sp. L1K21 TaxID=2954933 RepID=UPI002093A5DF|nr:SCP2 sterol-binding domain-containing protein [Rhizobium sp. L1K21]MCO6185986.1 SCP2 sterol-binding domain-containing protein [Rhizobium sp. L1K21]